MFTTNGRNQLLSGTDIAFASLHSAFPGQTGAAEIVGGTPAYARKSITFAAANAGQRLSTNSPVFDVPGGALVNWIGFDTLVTAGTEEACSPNGAQPKQFQVDVTNNMIVSEGHGYVLNQTIVFYGGTPPIGLTEGTTYYVIAPTTNNFQVSATASGAAIVMTGQASLSTLLSRIVAEQFSSQGTFTLNSGAALSLNY